MTRREVLQYGSLSSLGLLGGLGFSPRALAAEKTPSSPLFSAIGMATSIAKAPLIKAAGGQFITESVASFLVPDKADAVFAENLKKLADCPLPILACNGFIRPAHLRAVGAEANHPQVLDWASIAFRRLKQAGGTYIIFGSGNARQIKDGWPLEKAEAQFVALLQAMGPLAEKEGVTVIVEQLRASECNFINRISDGAKIIRAAGHPHVRLLADLYHMAAMGDSPADLQAALDVVVHVEIAENNSKRSVPGVAGDDFRPYFRALRAGGYKGAINIEANGSDAQITAAFPEILKQAAQS